MAISLNFLDFRMIFLINFLKSSSFLSEIQLLDLSNFKGNDIFSSIYTNVFFFITILESIGFSWHII